MNEHMTLAELLREFHSELSEEGTIVSRANAELTRIAANRIEALEAALRDIIDRPDIPEREQAESVKTIARAALAAEQDK